MATKKLSQREQELLNQFSTLIFMGAQENGLDVEKLKVAVLDKIHYSNQGPVDNEETTAFKSAVETGVAEEQRLK